MHMKTLLVCLTTPEHSDVLMKFAAPLAHKHGAHLIGLHTLEQLIVYTGAAVGVPEATYSLFDKEQNAQSDAIKAIFERHTKNETFAAEFRLSRADGSPSSERMIQSAHTADLVVMAQPDKTANWYDQRGTQIDVIRNCGCPVIVVPNDYDDAEIGKNIVLGWSDTREAARASHDMLRVADSGANVTILRVGKSPQDALADTRGISIAERVSRHGLSTTLAHRNITDGNIAEMLDQVAFEQGADLIVTGALGHSKVYDFVIGATTHALLKCARVPVMFSK